MLLTIKSLSFSMSLFLPQTEIAKRLNTICAQVIPFLSQEVSLCDFKIQTVFYAIYTLWLSLQALLINQLFSLVLQWRCACVFCSISSRWSKLWSEQNRWPWQSSMPSSGYVDCRVCHPQCVFLYVLYLNHLSQHVCVYLFTVFSKSFISLEIHFLSIFIFDSVILLSQFLAACH